MRLTQSATPWSLLEFAVLQLTHTTREGSIVFPDLASSLSEGARSKGEWRFDTKEVYPNTLLGDLLFGLEVDGPAKCSDRPSDLPRSVRELASS